MSTRMRPSDLDEIEELRKHVLDSQISRAGLSRLLAISMYKLRKLADGSADVETLNELKKQGTLAIVDAMIEICKGHEEVEADGDREEDGLRC